MVFTDDEVETIFWALMANRDNAKSNNQVLNKIFEVYAPCPLCGGFFLKDEGHTHNDEDFQNDYESAI